jgi:hypothetical protein
LRTSDAYALGCPPRDPQAESLQAALNGEHASEIIADIRNFTNAEPVIQINDRFVAPS